LVRRWLAPVAVVTALSASGLSIGPLHAAAPAARSAAVSAHHPKTPLARLKIRHVFVVVLENESFAASYRHNPNPYLGKRLQRKGTLLTHYFGIGHESNDNYLAMISGQAPSVATQSDCQTYVDFTPSPAPLDNDGQATGVGCVYPRNVKTLPDQLKHKHISWAGYMEDMGNDLSREPSRCGEPAASAGSGMPDGTQKAAADDQYAARHNPFVYFHSLIDSGSCHRHVVPLAHLQYDLRKVKHTPRFSFITPNLCNDGHDAPCAGKDSAGGNSGGLVSVDNFLKLWVPRIKHSPAYRHGGLLIITSDESTTSDDKSCCGEKPGPNSPKPGINGPGGGRVGTLMIGRCVRKGATDAKPYNHYSLLRSLEDLYGVRRGGSDRKGHLGFAGAHGLRPFGPDVFRKCARRWKG
jgi:hypothetical protein